MTMNLVPEIEIILDMVDNFDPNENKESDIFLLAQDFNMQASWLESHTTNRRTFYDLSGRMLTNTLYENFDDLKAVDLITSDKTVILTYNISGKILSNVSKKLDYLVTGEKPTAKKIKQAKELSIKIISQSEWKKLLN